MGSSFFSPPVKRNGMPDPSPYSANGSFKRSKNQNSPLTVPPGHVVFRLLCHASRIGGIIGKSGNVIKNLQQITGAKIRIEDAPAESPDRVVVVIAPSALSGRIVLSGPNQHLEENGRADNGNEGGGVRIEASKAQEALVKVFEKILDVAAETDGIEVGVGTVSCRLLADAAQVGSVIGKGGKVVEKIRKDTGCKIRVLSDKLPACTTSSDEMIEIEGNVLSVKKALVAVSRRLQDCPLVDIARTILSKPLEVVQHDTLASVPRETLTDLHVDHLLQRNSVLATLPSSSKSYATGVHSLSVEVDRVPTLDLKPLNKEITFKILCPNDRVGAVIGKGGSIVKALQNETGATISVGAAVSECDERLITVTASENPELRYSPAQKAIVLIFSRAVEGTIEKGLDSGMNKPSLTARLVVTSNQVGCLLGKGGMIVSEMRKVTGTGIHVIGSDQVPKCTSENDQVVQISGEFSNVQDALYHVTGRLRDNLLSNPQNSTGTSSSTHNMGTTSVFSLLATNTSPYSRLRDTAHVGGSFSLSRHTLTQSLDHLGYSCSLDRPTSPRLWTTQTIAGISSRGISDVGINLRSTSDFNRGLTSLKGGPELGSGIKSAIVTNTTVEIMVPENVIGCVYGENGNNLARLKQISGAKVTMHEPRPGTSDRIIVISGTPDETQAAQSLLQAFILTGSS